MFIKMKQFIISFKGKNIIYFFASGEGGATFPERRKGAVLSLLVGLLLFTFDLDTGGYVPVLLHMPTRIGSGWTPAAAPFFPVEIRSQELIAQLVKAQDREEEASIKVLVMERSWNLPDPGTLRATKLLKEKVPLIER